jgi:nickel/cobalt exporter
LLSAPEGARRPIPVSNNGNAATTADGYRRDNNAEAPAGSTIGGAGRAPDFEIASAVLIIAIGLWLLFRALHPHEHMHTAADGRVLAFVTGLVPCPLTTFIMVYATAQGIIAAGLLVTAGMAVGMTVTIALFALAAVLLHDRFMVLMARTDRVRRQLGRGLEVASAIAIVAFGAWLLSTR